MEEKASFCQMVEVGSFSRIHFTALALVWLHRKFLREECSKRGGVSMMTSGGESCLEADVEASIAFWVLQL
jgi:hypothetical protein